MFRHILVPTDGSALSARAMKLAVKLAKSGKARITFFHVVSPFRPVDYMDGMLPAHPELFSEAAYRRAAENDAQRMLAKAVAHARAAKVPCEARTAYEDPPWKAIVRTARSRGCDLILMASHGRRGIEGVLLGSEAHKVLTHSKTPVLISR
jgi:nucleotide-binding universal stress UspA family protein